MSDSYDALRLRLEAGRSLPLTVCVASAKAEDDAGAVAYGLAIAFSDSGTRTLAVLESDPSSFTETTAPRIDTLSSILKGAVVTQPNGVDTVCLPADGEPERRVASRAVNRERRVDARAALLGLRETYQAIVLEANEAGTRSPMLERATLADIAIVTVRLGRAKCAADAALMERLAALGVPVLGIVTSSATSRDGSPAKKAKASLNERVTVQNRT